MSPPRPLRGLVRDTSGGAAITLAIGLSALVGLAGLGTEAASWYVTKRTMQGAADTAAYTAAVALSGGATPTEFTTDAKSISAGYNFVDGSASVTVTVNNPPQSGSYANNSNAVEVVINQPQTPLLSAIFLDTGPTIQARGVALATSTGNGCILALDRGNVVGFVDSGSTTLNLTSCALYVNSDDSTAALSISGSATINAAAAYVVGGVQTNGGATINTTTGTFTGTSPINDPYANVPVPSFSGCDQTNFSLTSGMSRSLNAGAPPYVFCNGLSLTGGSTLTLGAGIYVIDQGSLSISGNSTLNASAGATIVLTSSTGANYPTVSISGGANVSITAPTTGSTAGIALYQDRNAPSSGADSLTGGSTQNIVGAIYFPNQTVTFSGGSTNGSARCTQLVALKLSFTGGTTLNSNCTGVGVASIGSTGGRMVE